MPISPEAARLLRSEDSTLALVAVDSKVGGCVCVSSVSVLKLEVPREMALDEILSLLRGGLSEQTRIVSDDSVPVGRFQARRLVVETPNAPAVPKELVYLLKSGSTLWLVTYHSFAQEFDSQLPIFE